MPSRKTRVAIIGLGRIGLAVSIRARMFGLKTGKFENIYENEDILN